MVSERITADEMEESLKKLRAVYADVPEERREEVINRIMGLCENDGLPFGLAGIVVAAIDPKNFESTLVKRIPAFKEVFAEAREECRKWSRE